jgi:hypothetical protein
MLKQALRTIMAMAAGYATTLLLTAIAFVPVALFRNDLSQEPGTFWRTALVMLAAMASVVGGYVGAWIAGRREIRHGLYVGGLTLLAGLAWGNVRFGPNDPLLFRIALLAVALPAAGAGGWLRARRMP